MEDKEFEQLTPEEKKERFQNAVDNYNQGFMEEDCVLKTVDSVKVKEALEDAGKVLEEFGPAQKKVIFEVAKADAELDYFMNPKFSATHMKFILEQLLEGKDVTRLPVGKYHENIIRKPLTKAKIENIRKRMESRESVIADLKGKKKETTKEPKKQGTSKEKGER